jgi:hypothetical protein
MVLLEDKYVALWLELQWCQFVSLLGLPMMTFDEAARLMSIMAMASHG